VSAICRYVCNTAASFLAKQCPVTSATPLQHIGNLSATVRNVYLFKVDARRERGGDVLLKKGEESCLVLL